MTHTPPLPPVSKERPLFTWLVCAGVIANLAIASLIAYVYLVP